jgi:hypothetical protein
LNSGFSETTQRLLLNLFQDSEAATHNKFTVGRVHGHLLFISVEAEVGRIASQRQKKGVEGEKKKFHGASGVDGVGGVGGVVANVAVVAAVAVVLWLLLLSLLLLLLPLLPLFLLSLNSPFTFCHFRNRDPLKRDNVETFLSPQ